MSQLASYTPTAGIDVGALAGACANRQKGLEELIASLPGRDGKGRGRLNAIEPTAGARIKTLMVKLREQSIRSIEVLSRAKDDVAAELAGLSHGRRAVRAYGGTRHKLGKHYLG